MSTLRVDLPELSVSEAVSSVLNAHLQDMETYNECKRKHEALREWISAE